MSNAGKWQEIHEDMRNIRTRGDIIEFLADSIHVFNKVLILLNEEKNSPLDVYMRHIAHANHIILKEVLDNIQNQNNNGLYRKCNN